MIINSLEELERNFDIISRYAKKFRAEITVGGGLISEDMGEAPYEIVVKFYDSLSDDVFAGSLMKPSILDSSGCNMVESIISGKMSYEDLLHDSIYDYVDEDEFRKRLKQYKEERA